MEEEARSEGFSGLQLGLAGAGGIAVGLGIGWVLSRSRNLLVPSGELPSGQLPSLPHRQFATPTEVLAAIHTDCSGWNRMTFQQKKDALRPIARWVNAYGGAWVGGDYYIQIGPWRFGPNRGNPFSSDWFDPAFDAAAPRAIGSMDSSCQQQHAGSAPTRARTPEEVEQGQYANVHDGAFWLSALHRYRWPTASMDQICGYWGANPFAERVRLIRETSVVGGNTNGLEGHRLSAAFQQYGDQAAVYIAQAIDTECLRRATMPIATRPAPTFSATARSSAPTGPRVLRGPTWK